MHGGPGNVAYPPSEYGVNATPLHRDLGMRIRRTPFRKIPYSVPAETAYFMPQTRVGIGPNGNIVALDGPMDDALSALDRMGTRGAAVLGAGLGAVIADSMTKGALVGGVLGYLAGKYLANIIKASALVQAASKATGG